MKKSKIILGVLVVAFAIITMSSQAMAAGYIKGYTRYGTTGGTFASVNVNANMGASSKYAISDSSGRYNLCGAWTSTTNCMATGTWSVYANRYVQSPSHNWQSGYSYPYVGNGQVLLDLYLY